MTIALPLPKMQLLQKMAAENVGCAEDHSAEAGQAPGDDGSLSHTGTLVLQTPGEGQDKGSAEKPPIQGRNTARPQLKVRREVMNKKGQPLQRETFTRITH